MVLFNFIEETKNIETVSRYNGGWLKTVTGLNKSKDNGFSIVGEFVKGGDYKMDYGQGLYLDCSKEGSRKNQVWNYHLFKVDQDGFHLIQTVENGGRHWACEFWENIEAELNNDSDEITSDVLINQIFEQTRDKKILKELYEKLGKELGVEEKYIITGTFGKTTTKKELESFFQFNGLNKISEKGLKQFEKRAIEKINETVDEELSENEWEDNLLIAELYSMISARFDMERCDYSQTWLEDIKKFDMGMFYEYKQNKYILINNVMNEVRYAKVGLRR
jgi:hypothetical protein